MNCKTKINKYLEDEITTIKKLDVNKINEFINILIDCLENNRRVFIFGNGGSGSTASHMTSDFNKALFKKTDKTFNFICLNDNAALFSAIANDEGYQEVFRYQLKQRLTKNDVVIALSGSGNSKNIINAVEYAKEIGATVVGFTGYDGGKLKKLSDISLDVNINNMQISEDIHLYFEHMIINIFYQIYEVKEYVNE